MMPEGASEVGERCGCAATDSVHQQLVRGGGMRRSLADSTNRALAVFGKLQHIRLNPYKWTMEHGAGAQPARKRTLPGQGPTW